MAQIQQAENNRPRRGVRRAKRDSTRIDMTPMVDLGFLLICFFVITTTMAQPRETRLIVPTEGPEMELPKSRTLTVLLSEGERIFYYAGDWENAFSKNEIFPSNYSTYEGIGNVIREKQKQLRARAAGDTKENEMILIIKASDQSSYGNLVDMLDEVLINDLKHYVIADLSAAEKEYVKK